MKRATFTMLLTVGFLITAVSGQQTTMTAHFIDVGQAHATLLEFPCGAMLVDAGADPEHDGALEAYLTTFFQRRSDLKRTLDVVLITHNHIDHSQGLRTIIERFTVRRYLDNGFTEGSGVGNPNWLKREVLDGRRNIVVREIADSAIHKVPNRTGLTDRDIDPFNCGSVDPRVRILSGSFDENPGWTESAFGNQNNHSLVTRIDFGQASFLFMGDLEEAGIETLLDFYGELRSSILNTDVLQVGHHGSHNATTPDLVRTVSPTVAVIPVGKWTFGQSGTPRFSTFFYGHPRQTVVNLLSNTILRRRPQVKAVRVADRSKKFREAMVRKAVYATGWDGTVRVTASSEGQFTVYRQH